MARQITNIHLGIMNWQVHLRMSFNDRDPENYLFDLPMAKQIQQGLAQVIEAIESQGAMRDRVAIQDSAVVRLIEGGQSHAENN